MNNYVTYDDLREISNRIVSSGKDVDVVLPLLVIISDFADCDITVTLGDTTLTASYDGVDYRVTLPSYGDYTVTCSKEIGGVVKSNSKVINISVVQIYEMYIDPILRYGYRIKKSEPDPYARVEYIYDAVGMKPAKMNFSTGVFDYGDWKDVWFVADNKPCMLKYDGTVDYYLDPDNYTLRDDGVTPSDVADTAYEGNAMSEIPLVWVKRYEDDKYCYTVISDVQVDDSYKAYAHTRADGTIADATYYSMFRGSGNATKIRSLAGQSIAGGLTAAQEVAGATANGSLWYTHTWSKYQLITALLVLMGKSLNARSVYGYGWFPGATSASGLITNGTLKQLGQFYGYNDNTHQVKVFHIEAPWGDQWDRLAGLILNNYTIFVKMTQEGLDYRINDVDGYTDTGITIPYWDTQFIMQVNCSEYGMIPTVVGGSSTTYFCCPAWSANNLRYLCVGGGADHSPIRGGPFTFFCGGAPNYQYWSIGCGLSCEKPAIA